MARIIKQFTDFKPGMSPYINSPGIARLEHFDVLENTLKPYRGLQTAVDDTTTFDAIHNIIRVIGVSGATAGSTLFGLARNFGGLRFSVVEWDVAQAKWSVFKASGADNTYSYLFHYYGGKFIGLTNGSHLWTITSAAVDLAAVAITYLTGVDIMTHSKDNLCYIATLISGGATVISSYNGTTITTGLTINNFTCTSISEAGDYLLIVGYDTSSYKSIAYLWDRDSSLTTLTGKYDIGYVQTTHCAVLGGTKFIVSVGWGSSNTTFTGGGELHIGYINGDVYKPLKKYRFGASLYGFKYIDGDNLYFLARITLSGSNHLVLLRLNEKGELFIEQNLSLSDTDGYALNCVIKDGDGFWIGITNSVSTAYNSYNSKSTYDLTSIFESNKLASPNLIKNIDFVGAAITFEPLPSGGSVIVKTRKDEETTWETIATFDTDNAVKGSYAGNPGTAKERQIRVESTGGAIINGIQVDLDEVDNEQYG